MSTEVAVDMEERTTTSGSKRTKLAETGLGSDKPFVSPNVVHVFDEPPQTVVADMAPPRGKI